MDQPDITGHVAKLVGVCEQHLDEQSKDRQRALEYHDGVMTDLKADEGRSSVVSKDVRKTIKKLMPSVMRTLMSNDKLVKYAPVAEEDVEGAEQATDYVNLVVVPECGAETALYDAIYDALLLKTGILKWTAYKKKKAEVHEFSDLSDEDVLGLFDDPNNEPIDHVKTEETDPDVLELDPNARRHSFKLRRVTETTDIRLEAVPRGSFLMSPDAETIEDAAVVGERLEMTRSSLVSMGFDKDKVAELATHDGKAESDDEDEEARKGDDWTDLTSDTTKALETVLVYEVYVQLDRDEDGIAEMHHIMYGAAGEKDGEARTTYVTLIDEPVADAPYADVVAERDAHQFEGHSVFEDVEFIQRNKTFLLRSTNDSVNDQNNPQPAVDLSQVEDADAIYNPAPGKPIVLKSGADAQRAIQWAEKPFVGDKAFDMVGYFDKEIEEQTGISKTSGGLDPENIANVNTGVANLAAESGIAQAEMIIRSLARGGIRKAFRGLLKLVIAHADGPRTVQIRGEWKRYDPAVWNVDMDCIVNVGLGAGTRERDMSVLQIVLGLQEKILATIGADNPYVKPEQLYNTLEKITETAGFPSADPYFTKPDPEDVQRIMAAKSEKPDAAIMKVQMQAQLDQQKAQHQVEIERAQMQADLAVKEAEQQGKLQIAELSARLKMFEHRDKMTLEYAKLGMPSPYSPQTAPQFPGAVFGPTTSDGEF